MNRAPDLAPAPPESRDTRQTVAASSPAPAARHSTLLHALALALIVVVALALRIVGHNWDENQHLNVDDYYVTKVALTRVNLPPDASLGRLLDPALVIVTSDHSWKAEPDRARRAVPESRTWVPLLVKLPHQTTGYRIPQRFCMGQLGALLERAMDGRLTEANGAREVPGLPSNAVCTIRSRPEPPD